MLLLKRPLAEAERARVHASQHEKVQNMKIISNEFEKPSALIVAATP